MSYVGNSPAEIYSSVQKQDLTGGSGTGFTLSYPVTNANEISVFVNNVRQEPTEAYTVSGTTLTMTGSIAATDDFYVIFSGLTQGTIAPPDLSVTTDKIAGSAVTTAKLASPVGIDTTSSTFKMTDLTTNAFYRTGTFTPFYGSSGASTAYTVDVFTSASYLIRSGSYVRVGDLVTANVFLRLDYSAAAYQNSGAASHTLSVGGFPFKWKNDSNYFPTTDTVYFNFDSSQGWSSYNLVGISNVHNVDYVRLNYTQTAGTISALTLENVFDQSGDQAQSLDSTVIFQMTYETDEA